MSKISVVKQGGGGIEFPLDMSLFDVKIRKPTSLTLPSESTYLFEARFDVVDLMDAGESTAHNNGAFILCMARVFRKNYVDFCSALCVLRYDENMGVFNPGGNFSVWTARRSDPDMVCHEAVASFKYDKTLKNLSFKYNSSKSTGDYIIEDAEAVLYTLKMK